MKMQKMLDKPKGRTNFDYGYEKHT
jgi:hypothetical protein